MRRILLVLALAAAVFACAARLAAAEAAPAVILISLDGTPPEAIRDEGLETFAALRGRGAEAERLTPVFPTNTFPNHVTFVTGVAPEKHGIVNNVFVDPERGLFSKDGDPTWIESEPLWSVAARHGIVSASFHWVGSEGPWRSGRGPRYWKKFDSSTPEEEKVDQILAWLDLEPARERPRLVTCWFHGADGAGHRYGPDSAQVRSALRQQDRALGRLLSGLDERGALESTTLILVSDHGMARVEKRVDLDDALEREGLEARVWGAGGFATVTLKHPEEAGRAAALARSLGLQAYPRDEAPAWRVAHRRFGHVVVMAPPGTALSAGGLRGRLLRGMHGYAPDEPSMNALFLAVGRGVRPGTRLGEVRAVDVAPTVLTLLGAPIPPSMEGRAIPGLAAPAAAEGSAP